MRARKCLMQLDLQIFIVYKAHIPFFCFFFFQVINFVHYTDSIDLTRVYNAKDNFID